MKIKPQEAMGVQPLLNEYGGSPQIIKNRTVYNPAISLQYITKGNEISNILKSYLHSHIHGSIIHNS